MVADRLDALCADFGDCSAVAYADLSIGMVLVTNTSAKLSREMLDGLCAEAGLSLGTDGKANIGSQPATMGFTASPTGSKVFVRAEAEPNDILFCLCSSDIDMAAFMPAAKLCLDEISGGTS